MQKVSIDGVISDDVDSDDIGFKNTSELETNANNQCGDRLSHQLPATANCQPNASLFYSSGLVQSQRVGCNSAVGRRNVFHLGESRR